MRNARFWAYVNGDYVKITLKPGQSLGHVRDERTDEGWASEAVTWWHEGSLVSRWWETAGRDCDGILRNSGEDECTLDDLHRVVSWEGMECDDVFWDGVTLPAWERRSASRYDQYAELAGY